MGANAETSYKQVICNDFINDLRHTMDFSKCALVFAVLFSIAITKASVIEKRHENEQSWENSFNQPEVSIDGNMDRQVSCGLNFDCLNGGTCDNSYGYPRCKCKAANYGLMFLCNICTIL